MDVVDLDSPAARAGLKKDDILEELNGRNANETGLFGLYSALCDSGQLMCIIRRDSEVMRLSISRPRHGQ